MTSLNILNYVLTLRRDSTITGGQNMKINFDKKLQVAFVTLVVLSLLACVSCISATNTDAGDNSCPDRFNTFTMTVPCTAGTGYHWEVSPETYGVDIGPSKFVEDNPGCVGSSGTVYFNFHINSPDYYVKLVLLNPTGEIVKEVDSNMIN